MRVLAVGNMYPPHHFGGYELVWRSAMRHLERHGHEVRVLTTDLRTGSSEPDDPGVHRELRWYWRDHEFPRMGRFERVRLERYNRDVLLRHLAEFRPGVVTWWSMGGMSMSMLERVRREQIPALGFVHDDWLIYGLGVDGWQQPFRGRMRRFAGLAARLVDVPTTVDLERTARYIFVSETTRRRAIESGLRLGSTGVAHSGIDPGFIDPAPEREWTWSLLYVGRLDERKGIHTAVAALAHLPAEATLTLAGGWDEQEEERLRSLAQEYGVNERVVFSGQLTRAEVRELYGECDVVVFPVIWEEPWGLVPLEGMARGRPVVATGRGGSGEYLRDGENAVLFEAGDAPGLAAAVFRVAGDPALRSALRKAGLDTAPKYTETRFNEAVLREVEEAAGDQPRPAPQGARIA